MANAVNVTPDARARLGFLRIKQVLELIPIARSSWWAGVKSGKYPQPIKLGAHTTLWYRADIEALIANAGNQGEE
jgi:prophage regulatory protein